MRENQPDAAVPLQGGRFMPVSIAPQVIERPLCWLGMLRFRLYLSFLRLQLRLLSFSVEVRVFRFRLARLITPK